MVRCRSCADRPSPWAKARAIESAARPFQQCLLRPPRVVPVVVPVVGSVGNPAPKSGDIPGNQWVLQALKIGKKNGKKMEKKKTSSKSWHWVIEKNKCRWCVLFQKTMGQQKYWTFSPRTNAKKHDLKYCLSSGWSYEITAFGSIKVI